MWYQQPILLLFVLLALVVVSTTVAFSVVVTPVLHSRSSSSSSFSFFRLGMSDDWSDFAALDDDDDVATDDDMDFTYANEHDTQEYKAQVGATLEAPSVEMDADPIVVPQGSVLPLTIDNVCGVLAACRDEIGTMFGYSAENRGVGITGGVDLVELDGPVVILRLKGRFWHDRPTVLARVGTYLTSRIPEIVDVIVEDEYQLTQEANDDA